jgi:hypothetical protein
MHLTRYCQGPSLLCHAQRGILPAKCSNEQMLSGCCPTTFQQQIMIFGLFRENVSVPTLNTSHGMPSLIHLSSTQSEYENSNVHYNGFDIDLSTPASADDQSINNDDPSTDHVIKKCSFERNTIRLPPDIAFQTQLLSQMNEHRGNDLNMLNQVIRCVKAHAIHYKVDYTTLQILSRKQLVQLLARYYQLNFCKPTLHSVPLTNGSVATVPIFDVKAILVAFLNGPLQMCEENLLQIMTSLQERQKRENKPLVKYTLDHFGNR